MNSQKLLKPALLVVDMQYFRRTGKFKPEPDKIESLTFNGSHFTRGLANISKLISEMGKTGVPVIFTKISHFPEMGELKPKIIPELLKTAKKNYSVITKEYTDAFEEPELLKLIIRHGINSWIICGGEKSVCAFDTLMSAIDLVDRRNIFISEDTLYSNKRRQKKPDVQKAYERICLYQNVELMIRDINGRMGVKI